GLLCFRNTRLFGLYVSFALMSGFSIYIYLILNYSDFIPCSCGGVIENLGWTQHLIFNGIFTGLALIAILIIQSPTTSSIPSTLLKSFIPDFITVAIVILLFLSSEHIIKKENNFTRRFAQHPITKDTSFNLGANSYYFAGFANNKIYLGNYTSPFL